MSVPLPERSITGVGNGASTCGAGAATKTIEGSARAMGIEVVEG